MRWAWWIGGGILIVIGILAVVPVHVVTDVENPQHEITEVRYGSQAYETFDFVARLSENRSSIERRHSVLDLDKEANWIEYGHIRNLIGSFQRRDIQRETSNKLVREPEEREALTAHDYIKYNDRYYNFTLIPPRKASSDHTSFTVDVPDPRFSATENATVRFAMTVNTTSNWSILGTPTPFDVPIARSSHNRLCLGSERYHETTLISGDCSHGGVGVADLAESEQYRPHEQAEETYTLAWQNFANNTREGRYTLCNSQPYGHTLRNTSIKRTIVYRVDITIRDEAEPILERMMYRIAASFRPPPRHNGLPCLPYESTQPAS